MEIEPLTGGSAKVLGVSAGVAAVGLLSSPQLHNDSEKTTVKKATILFMFLLFDQFDLSVSS